MKALRVLTALGLLLSAGCGFINDLDDLDAGSGAVCFEDSECVPDACCGRGVNSVYKDNAPDCRAVLCDGTCPAAQLRCGCAIPVCRNQRCGVAVTTGPGCM
ncbi:MAG: hypothetical protein ACT4TC_06420 [Myxococcaceae bacterium]